MRLLVFSDSHHNANPMLDAVERERPDAVLFLGDGLEDLEALRLAWPGLDIRAVRGNCDWGQAAEEVLTPVFQGVRLFMTHGHRYHVKYALEPLANAAHFSGAALALYGHTHERDYRKMGDVTVFNPGAVEASSAGLIEIQGGSFQCSFLKV